MNKLHNANRQTIVNHKTTCLDCGNEITYSSTRIFTEQGYGYYWVTNTMFGSAECVA